MFDLQAEIDRTLLGEGCRRTSRSSCEVTAANHIFHLRGELL